MMHIINKQTINLQLRNQQHAFRMQHLISEQYWKQIVPLLENMFDAYASEEEVIRLDTLEIDLGIVAAEVLENSRWDDALLAKIKQQLAERLAAAAATAQSTVEQKGISICRQWLFYMQHGYLHWSTLAVDAQWHATVLETLATDFIQVAELRRLVQQDKAISFRIAQQHSNSFLIKLTEVLTAQSQKKLPTAIEEIATLLKLISADESSSTYNNQNPTKHLWQAAIYAAAAVNSQLTTEQIIHVLLLVYKETLQKVPPGKAALFENATLIATPLQQVLETIRNPSNKAAKKQDSNKTKRTSGKEEASADKAIKTGENKINTSNDEVQNISEKEKQEPGKKATFDTTDQQPDAEEQPVLTTTQLDTFQSLINSARVFENSTANPSLKKAIPDDGMFVQHAGMVLVHPFLHIVFERLELTAAGYFIDVIAQQKAICLLHYITTGSTEADEYELVIPRLLCAYPLNIPVQKEIIQTTAALAEADDMLIACIQQWEKIGNTSPTGLREGFLQRNGKLSIKDDSPYLQIEKSGIDILLDYLPWNISIIKLPWMKEILRVEWR